MNFRIKAQRDFERCKLSNGCELLSYSQMAHTGREFGVMNIFILNPFILTVG
jgi:hypothetical protein